MSNDGQGIQDDQIIEGEVVEGQTQDSGVGTKGSSEAANNPGAPDDAVPHGASTNGNQQDDQEGSAEKDPKDWATGDEDATPAQKSYLSTMAVEAKEAVPDDLTKAEASEKINELQQKTGRDTSSERP